jgi:hypothetical protein
MKVILLLTVLKHVLAKNLYENYSFDYSAHKTPLAYSSYGNAIELTRKVKLSSKVMHKGGAYVLNRPITFPEFEI